MRLLFLIGLLFTASCTFLENVAVQSEYARIQKTDPSMMNLKHMIDRPTYFVYGKVLDPTARYAEQNLAIAAFSDRYRPHERVDMMHQLSPIPTSD